MLEIPTETLTIVMLGMMLLVFVGALAVAALGKRRSRHARIEEDERARKDLFAAMNPDDPALPATPPPPPSDPLARHRHMIAIENRAREDAVRILERRPFAENDFRGEACGIRILAGPGPLGAVALGVARHLDSLGCSVVAQVLYHPEKLGEEAQRAVKTLQAARLKVIESPAPQALDGVRLLVDGVDRAYLPEQRVEQLETIHQDAGDAGVPIETLDAFDVAYRPDRPGLDDLVIPVPDQVLSREDTRLLDSLAQDHYGIPGAALMENAGFWGARQAYLVAVDLAAQENETAPNVVVLCGRGNNGGDGFVMARHLHQWGLVPRVFLLGAKDRVTDDNGHNLRLLEAEGVKVTPLMDESQWPMVEAALADAHLIVDAVLGTGMSGAVRGPAVKAIECMNAARANGAWILAVDGPSGLDCNTGEPWGSCVMADVTVTFASNKMGFTLAQGPALCGKVVLADIGLPRELYRRQRAKSLVQSPIERSEA